MSRGKAVGGMSRRTAAWLAWSVCALSLALTVLGLWLLNLSHANTHIYDYWLENTIAAIGVAPVGALIVSRRPANPVGWLLCLYGVAFSIGHVSSQYAIYALLAQPGSLPAGQAIALISSWILPIIIGLQVFSYLLFPTGRLPGRRWRWVSWLTVAFVVVGVISSAFSLGANAGLGPIRNPLGIAGVYKVYDAVLFMLPLLYLAVASSLFVRLRRATGAERQQIKWFTYAAAATISGAIFAYMIPDTIGTPLWFERVGYALLLATTPAIPVAIGIAILRYRLYDIDILINQTLVYGSLTAMLAALYLGGVAATQAVFGIVSSHEQQPQPAIVVSILAIAALFNPLRSRIQSFIDRRFFRRKYDSRNTLEEFSASLRNETDLDSLTDDLLSVVRNTMQPARVSFWLLSPTEGSRQMELRG